MVHMSFRADFRAYVFDPNGPKEIYGTGYRVTGSVTYAISTNVGKSGYLTQWKTPGQRSFMLGLYVNSGQTVEVDYFDASGGDTRLTADAAVVAQLVKQFGVPSDNSKKWVGLVQPPAFSTWDLDLSQVTQGFVSFKVRVGIFPADGPQFIPVVARHRRGFNTVTGEFPDGDFKEGHMGAMWYVPVVGRAEQGREYVYGPRGIEWLDK